MRIGENVKEGLKQWREQKKVDWIEAKRRIGIEINLRDIEEKEAREEPLEWELELISKDDETKKEINSLIGQRREIELLTNNIDIKSMTEVNKSKIDIPSHLHKSGKTETERAKIRREKRNKEIQKYEMRYKEELKMIEKKEEDREKAYQKEKEYSNGLNKKKYKFYEKDLDYDSDDDKNRSSKDKTKMREVERLRDKELRRRLMNQKDESKIGSDLVLLSKDKCQIGVFNQYDKDDKMSETGREPTTNIIIEDLPDDDSENTDIIEKNDYKIEIKIGKEKTRIIMDNGHEGNDHHHNKYNDIKMEEHPAEREIEYEKNLIEYNQKKKEKLKRLEEEKIIKEVTKNIDMIEFQKTIFSTIPKEKVELKDYSIPWDFIIKYEILPMKINQFLKKKIDSFLGDGDNSSFLQFIMNLLESRSGFTKVEESLYSVLDTDTEYFVLQLWKALIYETLKLKKLHEIAKINSDE